ncbi:hypothetical protein WISP_28564 [Willisornis vidua]|uniref:Uncharacterized protein n=1 Tax=Willisornis vidua TaxID=1566151 RepID=A0ABQ9DQC6_9PASS|nr:hypothetical protein WISP_28564 [Willisornis vidua]
MDRIVGNSGGPIAQGEVPAGGDNEEVGGNFSALAGDGLHGLRSPHSPRLGEGNKNFCNEDNNNFSEYKIFNKDQRNFFNEHKNFLNEYKDFNENNKNAFNEYNMKLYRENNKNFFNEFKNFFYGDNKNFLSEIRGTSSMNTRTSINTTRTT